MSDVIIKSHNKDFPMNVIIVALTLLVSSTAIAQYDAPSLMKFQNTATNTNSASGGLTDSEKQISENYVHEGLQQRTVDELCKGNEDSCRGSEVKTKFLGVNGNLIKAIAKAYTTVIGMTDIGKLTKKSDAPKVDPKAKTEVKPAETTKEAEKKEDQTDYCKYIAVATEVVALFQQTTTQKNLSNIPTNQETAQKDSLYKASRSHDARADNAAMQRNGWGATTLCYGVLATQVQINTSYLIKLGAAGLLTWFYETDRKQNDDAAKLTKSIADKLPGKGYCNPATQRDCYCVQPEQKMILNTACQKFLKIEISWQEKLPLAA